MSIKSFNFTPDHNCNMVRRILILQIYILFCVLPINSAAAVSTVDCHCFRDRTFSPENPSAFDPYLLATVQNRLLAHSFSFPRKEIVNAKMSGALGETLWVAHWIAEAAGRQVADVQMLYAKSSSWWAVVKQLSVDPEKLGSVFWSALPDNDETLLAWAVVSQVSKAFLEDPEEDFVALQKDGATLKEAILACIMAKMLKNNALDIFSKARKLGNWGSLLTSSGLSVDSVEIFLSNSFSSR